MRSKRFPCCGIFGKLTGRALEGCEILSASKTVLTQCAPSPLAKVADWRRNGSYSDSGSRSAFFSGGLTRACLNTVGRHHRTKTY